MTTLAALEPNVITIAEDSKAWTDALSGVPHDIYHTLNYHQSSGIGTEGRPFLFSYAEDGDRFFWPYVLRHLADIPGCESLNTYDVTSGYGYPGPLISGNRISPEFLHRAWAALLRVWRAQRVVSAFTRFHPLLGDAARFPGCESQGENDSASFASGISEVGGIVSLDLTLPAEMQFRQYRKTLRQEIRKIRERGCSTFHDIGWKHSATLIELYNSTMKRLSAPSFYLIDQEWLLRLRAALGDHVHLLVTECNGQPVSVLLTLEYHHQVHAHLTGTRADFAQMSPLKVLLDDTRLWAFERGNHRFFLGGGVGGRRDSLFQFKAAFSPENHPFRLGRWIIDHAAYQTAVELRQRFTSSCVGQWHPGSFFPAYRWVPPGTPPGALAASDQSNLAPSAETRYQTNPISKDFK